MKFPGLCLIERATRREIFTGAIENKNNSQVVVSQRRQVCKILKESLGVGGGEGEGGGDYKR